MSLPAPEASKHLIPSVNVVASACGAPARRSPDIALEDWNELFDAVRQRLRLAVADDFLGTGAAPVCEPAARARATVLDCVSALEQLHASLKLAMGMV